MEETTGVMCRLCGRDTPISEAVLCYVDRDGVARAEPDAAGSWQPASLCSSCACTHNGLAATPTSAAMVSAATDPREGCSECGGRRVKGRVASTLTISPSSKSSFFNSVGLEALVCTQCGHTSLYVSDPRIFVPEE
jgi:hypothetical protein